MKKMCRDVLIFKVGKVVDRSCRRQLGLARHLVVANTVAGRDIVAATDKDSA